MTFSVALVTLTFNFLFVSSRQTAISVRGIIIRFENRTILQSFVMVHF